MPSPRLRRSPLLGLSALGAVTVLAAMTACSNPATVTAAEGEDSGPPTGSQDSGAGVLPLDAGRAAPKGNDASTAPNQADAAPVSAGDASLVGTDAAEEAASPSANTTRLIGYLPDYNGSYADWAKSIDFSKMTHINLAFADLPPCAAQPCTSDDDMTFSLDQSDADIASLVSAAHGAGVKVLLSVGGGGGTNPLTGDQTIIQFYNAGLGAPVIASLDSYVAAHGLDGVDLDIESPGDMGSAYVTFLSAFRANFRAEGKLVTAATGEWIETSMKSADVGPYNAALAQLDFVNNMVYSNLADATSGMQYYVQNGLSAGKLTLGVPFFGSAVDSKGNETDEPEYAQILSAYPDAWQSDSVSGGSLDDGEQITYVGEATMAKETLLGQQYGGIMIWELTGDAPAPHSLLSVIQNNL